jgi:ferritin
MLKKWTNYKKEAWTKEWIEAVKQYQEELKQIPRLYNYYWKDDKTKYGKSMEIPTKEYQKLKDKWSPIFGVKNE